MSRMKRPAVTFIVLMVLSAVVALLGVWLDFGPWAFFLTGMAAIVLSTLTDREAFYGPSPRSRR